MKAGAGALADGPEAGDRRPPLEVRRDAAAHEVRRRHDGDGLLRDVDAPAQALLVDVREALPDERGLLVGDVEEHVVRAGLLHLEVDRARDDVARREIAARIVAPS